MVNEAFFLFNGVGLPLYHLYAVEREEDAVGGLVEFGSLGLLQVDGVVLAKGENLEFDALADEVGEADEHGLAVPEVVLH